MADFSTPEEVLQAAERAAANDLARHLPVRHDEDGTPYQIDLNPYCTVGSRDEWVRGFHNTPPRSWEEKHRPFNFQFQRGAAARRLLDAHNANPRSNPIMTPKAIALFAATVAEEAQQSLSETPCGCTTAILEAIFDRPMSPKLTFAIASGEYDGLRWDEDGGQVSLIIPDLCRWDAAAEEASEAISYVYSEV